MGRWSQVGIVAVVFVLLAPAQLPAAAAPPPVLTQHNDNLRTGANTQETTLTTANVSAATFGKLFSRPVDGQVYAQPLYVPGLTVGGITHNVIFVATQHNSVYAFDADSPSGDALWKHTMEPSIPLNPLAGMANLGHPEYGNTVPANVGCCGPLEGYQDIRLEIGITSTPVIDAATNTMYLVTASENCMPQGPQCYTNAGYSYSHHLHALNILTGQERASSPTLITGSVSGYGDSLPYGGTGTVTFFTKQQIQRVALTLVQPFAGDPTNKLVYLTFGSFKDDVPYHGWIMGYDATGLYQRVIYNTTKDRAGGGIWMVGQGLAVDEASALYFMVGNGDYGTGCSMAAPCTTGIRGEDGQDCAATACTNGNALDGTAQSDSIVRLTPDLKKEFSDWFTPHDVLTYPDPFGNPNTKGYNALDLDLGSSGVLLIPGTTLLVGGGKTGVLYLLNRANLGHFQFANDSQIPQTIPASVVAPEQGFDLFRIYSSPVWWNNHLYVWPKHNDIVALTFVPDPNIPQYGQFNTANPVYAGTNAALEREAQAGGYLSVSSNGTNANSAILWAAHGTDNSVGGRGGMLHAFAANDITHELWNSEQNAARDRIDYQAKYVSPTIANGKVYIPTFDNSKGDGTGPANRLLVYGLLTTPTTLGASLPALTKNGATKKITVTAKQSDGTTTAVSYRGTVHFTSSDPAAVLPADYTFDGTENGTRDFDVVLNTGGDQTVTATDTAAGGLTATATTSVFTFSALSLVGGPVEGGATLVVTGTGFTAGAIVAFGVERVAATNVVVVNSTTITCTTPPHAAGTVEVTVTVGAEVITRPNAFTFGSVVVAPTPRPSATAAALIVSPAPPRAPAPTVSVTPNPVPPRR